MIYTLNKTLIDFVFQLKYFFNDIVLFKKKYQCKKLILEVTKHKTNLNKKTH